MRKASTLTLLRNEKGRDRKMELMETIRKNAGEMKKLDIDSFGEIMDDFIEQSACGLAVYEKEGEKEWTVDGSGCSSVIDFYIYLDALEVIYLRMLKEMKKAGGIDAEKLADALCNELKKSMVAAAKETNDEQ